MNYQLNPDGSIHIRLEEDEKGEAILLFRRLRNRDGYDPIAIEEALAVLEGKFYTPSQIPS